MNRTHLITGLLTAVVVTMVVFLYTLHFRFYSGSYTLMKLSHNISTHNKAGIEKLCNLKIFSDNFMSMLPLFENQKVVPLDTVFIKSLADSYQDEKYTDFLYTVYKLLQQTGGSMVNQREFTAGKGKNLIQYYKLKGRNYFIGISFYFERKGSDLQLQYIEDVFVKVILFS